MTKTTKILIVVLAILAVVLGVFYIILGNYVQEEEEVIFYPPSGLSDSIFESQNPEYVPNESFPQTVECTYIPYTYDTIAGDGVIIGSAKVFPAGDYFLYFSEVPNTLRTTEQIRQQFSQVLRYDCPDSASQIRAEADTERGFIDGFSTEFSVSALSVQMEDASIGEAHILSYRLQITAEDAYPYDLIIAVATPQLSNDSLTTCKSVLDALVYTVQYSDDVSEKILKQMDDEAKAAEKAASEAAKAAEAQAKAEAEAQENEVANGREADVNPSASIEPDEESNTTESSPGSLSDVHTSGIKIDKSYTNAVLVLTWTNPDAEPEIRLTDLDGRVEYEMISKSDGSMTFGLGEVTLDEDETPIVLKAEIKHYSECGQFQSEVREL